MRTTCIRMNPREHCPNCGALLVSVPGGCLCPHCGFELDEPEERLVCRVAGLPGHWGEGARFHLMDDRQEGSFDEAA